MGVGKKKGNLIRKNDHSALDVGAPCQTNPYLSRSSNVNVLRGNVMKFVKIRSWISSPPIDQATNIPYIYTYIPYMFTTYKSAWFNMSQDLEMVKVCQK